MKASHPFFEWNDTIIDLDILREEVQSLMCYDEAIDIILENNIDVYAFLRRFGEHAFYDAEKVFDFTRGDTQ